MLVTRAGARQEALIVIDKALLSDREWWNGLAEDARRRLVQMFLAYPDEIMARGEVLPHERALLYCRERARVEPNNPLWDWAVRMLEKGAIVCFQRPGHALTFASLREMRALGGQMEDPLREKVQHEQQT